MLYPVGKHRRKKDIFLRIPEVEDIIVFTVKGTINLIYGECVGFSETGFPMIENLNIVPIKIRKEYKTTGRVRVKGKFIIK